MSDIFGLTCSVLECSENTTLDDFGNGILVDDDGEGYFGSKDGKLKGEVRISRPHQLAYKLFADYRVVLHKLRINKN